ncbi:MAG TPA: M56 family metallopeptidase [Bryobacteraceae bacterium]|jgi:uncharacterized protein (TIGR03435 family)
MNPLAVGNHLWQSTVFAAVAWLLVQILRRNSARVRYSIWMLASLKFLLPFSLLIALGSNLSWPAKRHVAAMNVPVIEFMGSFGPGLFQREPLGTAAETSVPRPASSQPLAGVELAIWLVGVAAVAASWLLRVRRVRRILSTARQLENGREIESLERTKSLRGFTRNVRCATTESVIEPGIQGVFRPILVLPSGVSERLETGQLDAIIDHELSHIQRHDNLSALLHMAVEAIFWFHPLVWWIGARLVDERERACDEEVLRNGSDPKVYASAILKVCEFYIASPVECVAGVSGGNLKRRIEEIMKGCAVQRLNRRKKLLLTAAGMLAVALPMVVGILNAPFLGAQSQPVSAPTDRGDAAAPIKSSAGTRILAQQSGDPQPARNAASQPAAPKWEVVSIRPATDCSPPAGEAAGKGGGGANPGISRLNPSPGRLNVCTTLANLIQGAYVALRTGEANPHPLSASIEGGPSWVKSALYQITAKAEETPSLGMMRGPMMQALLEDRFKLKIHRETREVPVYALTVAKGGPKLERFKEGPCVPTRREDGSVVRRVPLETGQRFCKDPVPERNGSSVTLHAEAMSLYEFALVWLGLDRPVLDETGIAGLFDIRLEFAPDETTPQLLPKAGPSDEPAGGPSVFTAIQEQLGLKLEPTKALNHGAPFEGPGDVLIIDHVERPSEN